MTVHQEVESTVRRNLNCGGLFIGGPNFLWIHFICVT
jgi:hypothetical protein